MRIDDKYKWLARDLNGKLYAFVDKPYKEEITGAWDNISSFIEIEETNNQYSFIEWKDIVPYSVEDALQVLETGCVFKEWKEPIEQTDVVNKPSHYIGIKGLEMEEVLENFLPKIEDSYVSHRIGSAVEYLLRSSSKNGLQDIKKAKRNLEQVIAYEESKVKPEEVAEEPEPAKQPTDDHLSDFLACLRGIKVMEDKNMEKVSTFYAGTNPLD